MTAELSPLLVLASRWTVGFPCTLGIDSPAELPEPERGVEVETVFRPGYGWVERPVEVEEPEQESAVAA